MKYVIIIFVISLLLSGAAQAKEKKGKGSPKNPEVSKQTSAKYLSDDKKSDPWINFEINIGEKEIIENYIEQNRPKESKGYKKSKKKALPPGLAKKVNRGGNLPPGWQMKIARGEVMSADVYNAAQSLPDALRKMLPPSPEGSELITIDGKIVRLLGATRTILDVFELDPLAE